MVAPSRSAPPYLAPSYLLKQVKGTGISINTDCCQRNSRGISQSICPFSHSTILRFDFAKRKIVFNNRFVANNTVADKSVVTRSTEKLAVKKARSNCLDGYRLIDTPKGTSL